MILCPVTLWKLQGVVLMSNLLISIGNNVAAPGSRFAELASMLLLPKAKVGYNIAQFIADSAIEYR